MDIITSIVESGRVMTKEKREIRQGIYMNIDMREVRMQEACGYGAVHVIITSIIEPDCLSGGKILISLSSASCVINRIIWKSIKRILING